MNKNISKLFIIIIMFVSLFNCFNVTYAAELVFGYKETVTGTAHSNFKTQVDCETDRALFTKNHVGVATSMCATVEVAGYPIPAPKAADEPTYVTGQASVVENKSKYNFLAPIGNIKCMDSSGVDKSCLGNNIGVYLNFVFKLGIGLCAALAVIMLIINGVMYMGDESVFGKTEAKKKMFSAIFGLIIALAAWAILNTINPDLTGTNINIQTVSVDIEKQPLIKNDVYSEGQKTKGCPEGIVTASAVGITMPVCKSKETDFINMVTVAKSAGINLSGYGYRSTATQEQLRSQNCGGAANIYNSKATCNPDTALPGTSNHENGLAVDLKCDGVQIQTHDNKCFIWLQNNAATYGYKNLQSEPWHWSVNGS